MSSPPVTVDEAIRRLLAQLVPLPAIPTPLTDALGRVLGDTLRAPFPLPQWTNAAMDGYAVRGDDVRGASGADPVLLPVVGEIPAGSVTTARLEAGEAMRIFTGGRVPDGADSVIRQEDSDRGTPRVAITSDRDVGRNVRMAGSDVAERAVVLTPGTRIGPAELSLLHALTLVNPPLHRQPRVAIISSGDEVARSGEVDLVRGGARLADSNSPTLAALVTLAGGIPRILGPVRDDPDALAAAVRGTGDVDLLLTVGGVSVGDHDHVPAVMARLDAEMLFRRVLLRPGGPTTAARLPDGRLWIALPGNPVSAMVTFTLFAHPVIRALCGEATPVPEPHPVRLGEEVARHATLELFVRVSALSTGSDGVTVVQPTGGVGSARMITMRGARYLARIPPGPGSVAPGTLVDAIPFP